MMKLSDRVRIPSDVMARKVSDETVILDLASGTYFGLDAIGTQIWGLLEEGRSLREICDAMVASHEVTRERIEIDVLELARALGERHLIEPI